MHNVNVDLSKGLLDEFEARLARGGSLANKEVFWLLNAARGQIASILELYKDEIALPQREKSVPELFAEICFAPSAKNNRVSKEDVCAIYPHWFKQYVSPVSIPQGERVMARVHEELRGVYAYNLTHYLGIELTDVGQKLLHEAKAAGEVRHG